jgi:hypothetical protein
MERFRRGSTSPQEIFYYVVRHEHNLASKSVAWRPGEREAMEAQRQELCRIGARLPRRPKKKRMIR